jgi:hypothetical protein
MRGMSATVACRACGEASITASALSVGSHQRWFFWAIGADVLASGG